VKKTDAPDFGQFMTTEAQRFSRDIAAAEITTWFETFKRTSLDDFKLAWEQHRKDVKRGMYFPTINDLMRLLKVAGAESAARDWRCFAEAKGLRCNYPGAMSKGMSGGGPWHCAAHFALFGSEFTPEAVESQSLQIIERSQSYRAPKTYDELYRLNDARREGVKRQVALEKKRREGDHLPPVSIADPEGARAADEHIATADAQKLAAANAEASMAANEAIQ
jgi:hypothetical protein